MKWFGPTQFALFRIIFGLYLTVHFGQLRYNGYASELFSNEGVIKDVTILPAYKKLPLFTFLFDDVISINIFMTFLILASIVFTMGYCRRRISIFLFYGWISLFNRNPLISNPSIGYIGWLLLACALIPAGERLGFMLTAKQRTDEFTKNKYRWEVPDVLFYGSWIVVGISYTASGIHKLQCPSWIDGSALYYVLTSPLVRQDNPIVYLLLNTPYATQMMTWGSLFLEVSSLFLGTFRRMRSTYWLMYMGFHFGILTSVNFTDLTLGMIVMHLFTFDASWWSFTKNLVIKYDRAENEMNDFDINHSDDINKKPVKQIIKNAVIGSISSTSLDSDNSRDHGVDEEVDLEACVKDDETISLSTWSIYAVSLSILTLIIASKGTNIYQMFDRLAELTLNMYWGFVIIIGFLGVLMVLERIFPDQKLKDVPGWWKWVFIVNCFQLFAVILASFTWEDWLQNSDYHKSNNEFHLRDHVNPFMGGLIAYLLTTWLFYHWHKARHEVYFLYILFHQFHHSPSRIETITSFYKHPLEIIIDSQILAILLYSVLGLTNESSIWLSIFSAFGEYFYHMNIKTPRWIGYIFQRPESHRCHHRYRKRLHTPNYSDLPLWDFLGGTFENPETMDEPTGFGEKTEIRRLDMLFFKDVLISCHQDIFSDFKKFKNVVRRYLCYALVAFGSFNSLFYIIHYNDFRDIGTASVASPLPLVFSSYNGIETFATSFHVTITYRNGTEFSGLVNGEMYNGMDAPYNLRNVYGVMFSHAPFFKTENLLRIRDSVFHYAICKPGKVLDWFKLSGNVQSMNVSIRLRTAEDAPIAQLILDCDYKSYS